ncbi:MAG: hypothetical protein ACPGXL_01055 [Chitinophagales bacterium]
MNNKKFDHIISNRLNDFESPISEGMWDRIDSKRSWQTKLMNQVRASWLPFCLAATFFCASGYYLISTNINAAQELNSQSVVNTSDVIPHKQAVSLAQAEDLPLSSVKNSKVLSDAMAAGVNENAMGEKDALVLVASEKETRSRKGRKKMLPRQHNESNLDYTTNKAGLSNNTNFSQRNLSVDATSANGYDVTANAVQPFALTIAAHELGQQANANLSDYDWRQPLVKNKDKVIELEKKPSLTNTETLTNQASVGGNQTNKRFKQENSGIGSSQNTPSLLASLSNTNGFQTLSNQLQENVAENGLAVLNQHAETIPNVLSNTAEATSCPRFPGLKKGFISLDAIFTPEHAYRTLQNIEGSLSTYLQYREDNEQFDKAFSTGLRLGYNMLNGVSVRTGFEYAQITEIYTHAEESGFTITLTPVDTIETPNSGQVIVYDTTSIVPQYNYVNYTNKYRTVNVPLLIGYNIETNRLVLSVNGGVLLNLSSSAEGKIPTTYNLNPTDIETVNHKAQNLRLGLYGSVGFNYKLTNEMHLIAEPSIRYMLDPMYELPVKQNYYTLGVTTGLRWHF